MPGFDDAWNQVGLSRNGQPVSHALRPLLRAVFGSRWNVMAAENIAHRPIREPGPGWPWHSRSGHSPTLAMEFLDAADHI
jgi:hypothetical protein